MRRIAQIRWKPLLTALSSSTVVSAVVLIAGPKWGAGAAVAAILVQSQLKRVVERHPAALPEQT